MDNLIEFPLTVFKSQNENMKRHQCREEEIV